MVVSEQIRVSVADAPSVRALLKAVETLLWAMQRHGDERYAVHLEHIRAALASVPVSSRACEDLPIDLANALIREFMEIPEDSPYWEPANWVNERAMLNRIFRMGQCHAQDKTELAVGKD